jgi:hypothetical protein
MAFQVTEEDVERSSSLESSDIGKWCYLVQGRWHGFFNTQEEAEAQAEKVFK